VTTPVLPRRQRASLSFREKRWLLSGPGRCGFSSAVALKNFGANTAT
jgi:hypothetical protein